MDASDADISFDKHGVCNHCNEYEVNVKNKWPFFSSPQNALDEKVKEIIETNKKADYDCVLGISGVLTHPILLCLLINLV